MLDSLTVPVPTFSSLLALGGIFLILLYFYAAFDQKQPAASFPENQRLRERMTQLGIPNWTDLGKKAGLTRLQLRQVRRGNLPRLRLEQLMQLASALNWTLDELLQHFGLSKAYKEVEALRREGLRLREELQQQKAELTRELEQGTFEQLQLLLMNYPSVRKMVEVKPDLPAKNLTSLFTPLDNLLNSWGYEPIGTAWELARYDPQLHQPDTNDMEEGEWVYIRFIGYRDGDRILCPAKVSRTLPAASKQ